MDFDRPASALITVEAREGCLQIFHGVKNAGRETLNRKSGELAEGTAQGYQKKCLGTWLFMGLTELISVWLISLSLFKE